MPLTYAGPALDYNYTYGRPWVGPCMLYIVQAYYETSTEGEQASSSRQYYRTIQVDLGGGEKGRIREVIAEVFHNFGHACHRQQTNTHTHTHIFAQ